MTIEVPTNMIGLFVAIIFIIICICYLTYLIKTKDSLKDEKYNENNTDVIINSCKKYVCEYLKCPSTAQFPKIDIISQDKYGRIFIDLSVDSQNSFGAMIRTNFGVVLYPHNNEYRITDCGVCKYSFYKTEDIIKRINNWNKPL